MVRAVALVAAAASLALNAHAESLYSKMSGVLQINGPDYDRLIAKSNYTSIVEFYAPWCGHCKALKPAYEAAAKSLAGIAKVAAVNCDDEMNKPFCGQMGVQGFPTLKIVRPGKKVGKPSVEDYQGQRSAKAIVDTVKDKIPNTVKRVTDKNIDEWLAEHKGKAKAILFSDKGLVSATLRTLALDFAGTVPIAQIRSKEKESVEKYSITSFPSLVLLPTLSEDAIKYDGDMIKEGLVEFLSQVATPHPDCPPAKEKQPKSKKTDDKKASKASSKFSKSSASHKASKASSAAAAATDETVEDPVVPTKSPDPVVDAQKPIELPIDEEASLSLRMVLDTQEIQSQCLNYKSGTCVLALIPADDAEDAKTAIQSLVLIRKKHDALKAHIFPFLVITADAALAPTLITELDLGDASKVHLIATNGKRGWLKKYAGTDFTIVDVEAWIDSIRMGEGKREKLPGSLVVEAAVEKMTHGKRSSTEDKPIKIEVEEIPDEEGHDEL